MTIEVLGSSSAGNAYVLTDKQGNQLLLECGIPFNQITPHIDFNKLDYVLCSHQAHKDHGLCIKDFEDAFIEIWSPEDLSKSILIPNWKVTTMRLTHNVDCYGFMILNSIENKSIIFCTDTTSLPQIADRPFDCMMLECNYNYDKVIENARNGKLTNDGYKNHMALEDLVDWLKVREYKPKHLVAIHLSNNGNINKELVQKELPPFAENFYIAKKGVKIEI